MSACLRTVVRVVLAIVVALTGVALTGAASPAGAADAGQISGTVTGPEPTATPLEGIEVIAYLYDEPGDFWSSVLATSTDSLGNYSLEGLPAGTYRIRFQGNDDYSTEWYDDQPTRELAEDIVVPESGSVGEIDAALATWSHITGTVTGPGEVPLDGVQVIGYQYDPSSEAWWDMAYGETSTDGTYDLGRLSPGAYRVGFRSGSFVGEYWDDASDLASADDIVVGESSTVTGKDAELALGGTIAGTVTDTTGEPLQYVFVDAFTFVNGEWARVKGTETDASGDYDLGGLPAGAFKVRFGTEGTLVPEWWDDQPSLASAHEVIVTAGAITPDIDAEMAPAGRVKGTVTGAGGAPVADIAVHAYAADGTHLESVGWDETESDGRFEIEGLPAGDYKLKYVDERPDGGLAAEWWDDALTPGTATTFALAGGEIVTRDAELVAGAHLSGRVTDLTGVALPDVEVTAYRLVDGTYLEEAATDTDVSGDYGLGGLPAGTYTVKFDDGVGGQPTEYWDDAATEATATTIAVGASATVGSIDARLGIPEVTVAAPPSVSGAAEVGSTLTATAGAWTLGGVTTAYQWLADGSPIAGATGTTYGVQPVDLGRRLSVRVTASKVDYTSATATSAPTGPVVRGTITVTKKPKLKGKAVVSKRLKLKVGAYAPESDKVKVAWFADGKKIRGQKALKLVLTQALRGQTITAKVTVKARGYAKLVVATKGKQVA